MALMLTIGVLCYVAVAWPLNQLAQHLAGEPRTPIISHKLDYLRAHAGDYDLLLVGSSRFHYGINPIVLDGSLREAGCPVRTFNFGVQGLTAAELSWLTGKLAEIEGGRWKAVVIERTMLPMRTLRSILSDRAPFGNMTLQQAWLSVQAMATSGRGPVFTVAGTGVVVASYLNRQIGPGQIADLFEGAPRRVA